MTIEPNPIVSHEGATPQTEARSELSGNESLDTYTVSFPATALAQQINAALDAELVRIEQAFSTGQYNVSEREAQRAIAVREYRLDHAIAAYREWELSLDKGLTWKKFRTSGDPRREAVRWVIKLVSFGV
jgi:hypothetical protein